MLCSVLFGAIRCYSVLFGALAVRADRGAVAAQLEPGAHRTEAAREPRPRARQRALALPLPLPLPLSLPVTRVV